MAEDICSDKSVDGAKCGKKKYFNKIEHAIRKRCPPRSSRRENDIYVTNKSNFQVRRVAFF